MVRIMDIVKQIPNSLTITRLVLAFVFPFVSANLRITIIVIAIFTEVFDGLLARLLNCKTRLGALLDPIADKFFIISVCYIIVVEYNISLFEILLIAFRDIIVFFGALFLLYEQNLKPFTQVKPSLIGKVATTMQLSFIIYTIYTNKLNQLLIYVVMVVSILAGLDYLYSFRKNNFYR